MGREYMGELQLASKGVYYGDTIKDGVLKVEPWGMEEEQLILSPNINFDDTISRLISKLTDCPIPPEDLLLIDRYQIFLYMRCLTLGGEYTYRFHCEECNKENTHTIDIENDLDVVYVDDAEYLESIDSPGIPAEPFMVELPSGQVYTWRHLRARDEQAVDRFVRRMTRRDKRANTKNDYVYRAALRVVSVQGEEVDISGAMDFVKSIKGRDLKVFRSEIEAFGDFGVDMEVTPGCSNCGVRNEHLLPLGKGFLSARDTKSKRSRKNR